ncbi:MAG: hypothetical protein CMH54_04715 [Myxococcales bacterium]|nr:hypothetical protein [Myxococcales bacterium]
MKGSQLQPRARFAVACGMYREQPIWWCPFTKAKFRSKDFTVIQLRSGMNFAQFLRLPEMPTTMISKDLPADRNERVTVHLEPCEHVLPNAPVVEATVPSMELDGQQQQPLVRVESTPELGGSLNIVDDKSGTQLEVDPTSGMLEAIDEDEQAPANLEEALTQNKPIPVDPVPTVGEPQPINMMEWDDVVLDASQSVDEAALWDMIDEKKKLTEAYRASGQETLRSILRKKKIVDPVYHDEYLKWLKQSAETKKYYEGVNLRVDAKFKPKQGSPFPQPIGKLWTTIKTEKDRQRNANNMEFVHTRLMEMLLHEEAIEVKVTNALTASIVRHQPDTGASLDITAFAARKKRKAKRVSAADAHDPPPETLGEAIRDDVDGQDWSDESYKEFNGLTDLKVFDHGPENRGYTRAELHDLGIHSPPVGTRAICDNKRGADGRIVRHKVRIVVQGHRGNMFKGVHFNETYTATPSQDSARILQALCVHLQLKRKAWDISQAYCWADLPPGELIALRYPEGFRKFHNGEETFIVMRKNLYGHPAAARTWGQTRDKFILAYFNVKGWTCIQARGDPCFFHIMKGDEHAWILIHTDDVDAAGTSDEILDEIYDAMDKEWKVKEVNADYVLGVTRKQVPTADGKFDIECTMAQYCEAMAAAFAEHITKHRIETPFPEGITLSLDDEVTADETKAVIARGFQRGVGMILWASRGAFPECMFAASQLCKIMSRPSEKGWTAMIHNLKYMIQHKEFGIKFSHCGNDYPYVNVDSSYKIDCADGLCQFGFDIRWKGGPIKAISHKLKHVAHCTSHAEYMAMSESCKAIVGMRQLFTEIGLPELVEEPTALMGDNDTAIKLANDEKPTQGNQYIYTAYHFNKEVVKLQIVTTASIDTTENTADLQTKAVNTDKMSKLAGKLKGYEPDWYPTIRHDDSRTTSQSAQGTSKGLAAHSVQCSTNASTLC